MRKRFFIFLSCAAAVFPAISSCDILRDKPFEVAAWSPGPGMHSASETKEVFLAFTHAPDKGSIERAFSVKEDGIQIQGYYEWRDKGLLWMPASPLNDGRDYEVLLTTEAQAEDGLSLEARFEGAWSTKRGGPRPKVVSVEPADGENITDLRREIVVEFSVPVKLLSCVNEIQITPSIKGAWRVEDSGLKAVWTPAEPFKYGKTYKLSVTSFFESSGGTSGGAAFDARWKIGTDDEAPYLESVAAFDGESDIFTLVPDAAGGTPHAPVTENHLWEAKYKLKIKWNEAVNVVQFKSALSLNPALHFNTEPAFGYAELIVLTPVDPPRWNEHYLLRIAGSIEDASGNKTVDTYSFRIHTNGPLSKPPSLAGMRIPRNPADKGASEVVYDTYSYDDLFAYMPLDARYFPFDRDTETWFELYFDTADGAYPDIFSLMELFRVQTTNNALSFSQKSMLTQNFSEPAGADEFSNCVRAEVRGTLRNTAASGVVTFSIGKGLRDNYGNVNPSAMQMHLLD